MNISQKLSRKLIMLPSYGITACNQRQKLLKIRKEKLVEDKKRKTCKWIDLKIPADENVSVAKF